MEVGVEGEQRAADPPPPIPLPAGLASLADSFLRPIIRLLPQGPVVGKPISASPRLNPNPVSFSFVPKHFPG